MTQEQVIQKDVLEKYIAQQIGQILTILSSATTNIIPVYQGHLMALKKFAVDHDLKVKIDLRLEHIFPSVVKESEKEEKPEMPKTIGIIFSEDESH